MEIINSCPRDLAEIHDLATNALSHDTFSLALLEEKIFHNPNPDVDQYAVALAKDQGQLLGFMQTVSRPTESKAWLGLFATSGEHRRQQVAATLFRHVLSDWRAAGIQQVEALALPGNYFTPGIDPRYTDALCLLEHLGFERFSDCANLIAPLEQSFDTNQDELRLAEVGINIRRATAYDEQNLDEFFHQQFGSAWRQEATLACQNDPPALHLATQNGRVIAFSAHSSQNREWGFFGPMGTTPAARGKSIGRVLLRRCLNDLRDAGHQTAIIPWVGPIRFYARHVGARVDRVFWRYRLSLQVNSND